MPIDALRKKIGASVRKHLTNYGESIARARRDEKLFRDAIFGFQRLEPYEVLIVDSPLFQRLRGISQTGLAYLTYPSSIHTRFEHSINCLNISERILNSLANQGMKISKVDWAQVRLAALLHDIGHCIFSHLSEFFYRDFTELQEALNAREISRGNRTESELINYCILTCDDFRALLWNPIIRTCRDDCDFIREINLKEIAQMIIGMPPKDDPKRRYLAEVINGPLDVDKLDYLMRDAYFTGISLTVDIDRLLPSLQTASVRNKERKRRERRLVVDHRGIAVVEQLLFARMVLYDTVYHHHKVRAANSFFQAFLKKHCDKDVWPTTTKKLNSISDFLELDESNFLGHRYLDKKVRGFVKCLQNRILPERALVIAPRTLADKNSHTTWSLRFGDIVTREDSIAERKSRRFLDKLRYKILRYSREAGASKIRSEDVMIDIPEPPKYGRLGTDTLVKIVANYVEPLKKLFPFQKVVNNYSTQYKYRSYVFSSQKWRDIVAYAAFRAFKEEGIILNDLSLILAHQETGKARKLLAKNNIELPDWRKKFYAPDIEDEDID